MDNLRNLCVVILALTMCLQVRIANSFAMRQENAACPSPPGIPFAPIFYDLKGVNLYVEWPYIPPGMKIDPDFWKNSLTDSAVKAINASVMPFIRKNETCEIPPITILHGTNNEVKQPNTLTYVVKISFFNLKNLTIAAISLHVFRPDLKVPDYFYQVGGDYVTLISVDDDEETIKKKIAAYMNAADLMMVLYEKKNFKKH